MPLGIKQQNAVLAPNGDRWREGEGRKRPSWIAIVPRRVREDQLTEAELAALPPETIVTVVPNPRI
eukprot:2612605-Pleurochrysis_carterae.AAC.1